MGLTRRLGFLPVLLVAASLQAQTVQWASKVLDFSSQLTPVQYSAQEALGKPNVLPAGGQNPNAWSPDKPHKKEFLKLGYDHPISIRQIAIAESLNPSALYRIVVYDEQGKEYEVATLNPQSIPLKGRMLNVFMQPTPYKVAAVRLEFDGAALPDYFGIDAVAISDSNYPIIADIPKPLLLASGITTERLSDNVNSKYDDLGPLLSPDGKTLYFSRQNSPGNAGGVKDKEDIWYSQIDSSGNWQLAKNMGPEFNNSQPNFISSISSVTPDGKSAVMVLGNKYKDNGKATAGVSISTFINGNWTKPVALNIKDDYNMAEKADYFLADNRKTLIMSVSRADSYGDRDLYVSFMGADSVWSEPLNLGDVVNTAAEESAPFLASDNVTLYFSSKGFSGYGGSDIYVTRRLDDTWTNWSDPENLGPEINSPMEDLYFNIPARSDYAYYSRSVDSTNIDIFRIKLPITRTPEPVVTVRGVLHNAKTGEPLAAKVIYERLPDGTELGINQSNDKGEYELRLPAGNLYGIRAEKDGYVSENQNIDLRNLKGDTVVLKQDFNLQPIEVAKIEPEATITLNNIFFDFDKSFLKPESFPELNRLVDLMNKYATMQVQVSGHTDSIGTAQYNMGLSERRARSVEHYLVSKGIDDNRIVVKFFGESMPLVPNNSIENRRKNRRVEFKILKP